jgi:hypothetical protein
MGHYSKKEKPVEQGRVGKRPAIKLKKELQKKTKKSTMSSNKTQNGLIQFRKNK